MKPHPATFTPSLHRSISRLRCPTFTNVTSIRFKHKYSGVQSASDKLFADAAREEAEAASSPARPSRLTVLEQQHENWTGDESVQDAVLRMLVDKYKPLRSGTIQSAEQKLKRAPPSVHAPARNYAYESTSSVPLYPPSGSWADEPLLPSSESHRPWHTTYKAPEQSESSIKLARLPPPISARKARHAAATDERALKKEREEKKRTQQAGRLTQARESTLDYRLGIKHAKGPARVNPVSVKGWTSLVEDKIEKARSAGLFKTVKGRGQPLVTSMDERNPFIAREEFLMNRIVQRNGAAPPWVEVQGELDAAVISFREILRQAWIRRVLRVLTTSHPPELLRKLTMSDIQAFRDPEWVKREESYHDTAIEQVNSLVRKYNGLAPYSVRRPYYIRSVEVERLYERCAEDILRALVERGKDSGLMGGRDSAGGGGGRAGVGSSGAGGGDAVVQGDTSWGISDLVRSLFDKVASRWRVSR